MASFPLLLRMLASSLLRNLLRLQAARLSSAGVPASPSVSDTATSAPTHVPIASVAIASAPSPTPTLQLPAARSPRSGSVPTQAATMPNIPPGSVLEFPPSPLVVPAVAPNALQRGGAPGAPSSAAPLPPPPQYPPPSPCMQPQPQFLPLMAPLLQTQPPSSGAPVPSAGPHSPRSEAIAPPVGRASTAAPAAVTPAAKDTGLPRTHAAATPLSPAVSSPAAAATTTAFVLPTDAIADAVTGVAISATTTASTSAATTAVDVVSTTHHSYLLPDQPPGHPDAACVEVIAVSRDKASDDYGRLQVRQAGSGVDGIAREVAGESCEGKRANISAVPRSGLMAALTQLQSPPSVQPPGVGGEASMAATATTMMATAHATAAPLFRPVPAAATTPTNASPARRPTAGSDARGVDGGNIMAVVVQPPHLLDVATTRVDIGPAPATPQQPLVMLTAPVAAPDDKLCETALQPHLPLLLSKQQATIPPDNVVSQEPAARAAVSVWLPSVCEQHLESSAMPPPSPVRNALPEHARAVSAARPASGQRSPSPLAASSSAATPTHSSATASQCAPPPHSRATNSPTRPHRGLLAELGTNGTSIAEALQRYPGTHHGRGARVGSERSPATLPLAPKLPPVARGAAAAAVASTSTTAVGKHTRPKKGPMTDTTSRRVAVAAEDQTAPTKLGVAGTKKSLERSVEDSSSTGEDEAEEEETTGSDSSNSTLVAKRGEDDSEPDKDSDADDAESSSNESGRSCTSSERASDATSTSSEGGSSTSDSDSGESRRGAVVMPAKRRKPMCVSHAAVCKRQPSSVRTPHSNGRPQVTHITTTRSGASAVGRTAGAAAEEQRAKRSEGRAGPLSSGTVAARGGPSVGAVEVKSAGSTSTPALVAQPTAAPQPTIPPPPPSPPPPPLPITAAATTATAIMPATAAPSASQVITAPVEADARAPATLPAVMDPVAEPTSHASALLLSPPLPPLCVPTLRHANTPQCRVVAGLGGICCAWAAATIQRTQPPPHFDSGAGRPGATACAPLHVDTGTPTDIVDEDTSEAVEEGVAEERPGSRTQGEAALDQTSGGRDAEQPGGDHKAAVGVAHSPAPLPLPPPLQPFQQPSPLPTQPLLQPLSRWPTSPLSSLLPMPPAQSALPRTHQAPGPASHAATAACSPWFVPDISGVVAANGSASPGSRGRSVTSEVEATAATTPLHAQLPPPPLPNSLPSPPPSLPSQQASKAPPSAAAMVRGPALGNVLCPREGESPSVPGASPLMTSLALPPSPPPAPPLPSSLQPPPSLLPLPPPPPVAIAAAVGPAAADGSAAAQASASLGCEEGCRASTPDRPVSPYGCSSPGAVLLSKVVLPPLPPSPTELGTCARQQPASPSPHPISPQLQPPPSPPAQTSSPLPTAPESRPTLPSTPPSPPLPATPPPLPRPPPSPPPSPPPVYPSPQPPFVASPLRRLPPPASPTASVSSPVRAIPFFFSPARRRVGPAVASTPLPVPTAAAAAAAAQASVLAAFGRLCGSALGVPTPSMTPGGGGGGEVMCAGASARKDNGCSGGDGFATAAVTSATAHSPPPLALSRVDEVAVATGTARATGMPAGPALACVCAANPVTESDATVPASRASSPPRDDDGRCGDVAAVDPSRRTCPADAAVVPASVPPPDANPPDRQCTLPTNSSSSLVPLIATPLASTSAPAPPAPLNSLQTPDSTSPVQPASRTSISSSVTPYAASSSAAAMPANPDPSASAPMPKDRAITGVAASLPLTSILTVSRPETASAHSVSDHALPDAAAVAIHTVSPLAAFATSIAVEPISAAAAPTAVTAVAASTAAASTAMLEKRDQGAATPTIPFAWPGPGDELEELSGAGDNRRGSTSLSPHGEMAEPCGSNVSSADPSSPPVLHADSGCPPDGQTPTFTCASSPSQAARHQPPCIAPSAMQPSVLMLNPQHGNVADHSGGTCPSTTPATIGLESQAVSSTLCVPLSSAASPLPAEPQASSTFARNLLVRLRVPSRPPTSRSPSQPPPPLPPSARLSQLPQPLARASLLLAPTPLFSCPRLPDAPVPASSTEPSPPCSNPLTLGRASAGGIVGMGLAATRPSIGVPNTNRSSPGALASGTVNTNDNALANTEGRVTEARDGAEIGPTHAGPVDTSGGEPKPMATLESTTNGIPQLRPDPPASAHLGSCLLAEALLNPARANVSTALPACRVSESEAAAPTSPTKPTVSTKTAERPSTATHGEGNVAKPVDASGPPVAPPAISFVPASPTPPCSPPVSPQAPSGPSLATSSAEATVRTAVAVASSTDAVISAAGAHTRLMAGPAPAITLSESTATVTTAQAATDPSAPAARPASSPSDSSSNETPRAVMTERLGGEDAAAPPVLPVHASAGAGATLALARHSGDSPGSMPTICTTSIDAGSVLSSQVIDVSCVALVSHPSRGHDFEASTEVVVATVPTPTPTRNPQRSPNELVPVLLRCRPPVTPAPPPAFASGAGGSSPCELQEFTDIALLAQLGLDPCECALPSTATTSLATATTTRSVTATPAAVPAPVPVAASIESVATPSAGAIAADMIAPNAGATAASTATAASSAAGASCPAAIRRAASPSAPAVSQPALALPLRAFPPPSDAAATTSTSWLESLALGAPARSGIAALSIGAVSLLPLSSPIAAEVPGHIHARPPDAAFSTHADLRGVLIQRLSGSARAASPTTVAAASNAVMGNSVSPHTSHPATKECATDFDGGSCRDRSGGRRIGGVTSASGCGDVRASTHSGEQPNHEHCLMACAASGQLRSDASRAPDHNEAEATRGRAPPTNPALLSATVTHATDPDVEIDLFSPITDHGKLAELLSPRQQQPPPRSPSCSTRIPLRGASPDASAGPRACCFNEQDKQLRPAARAGPGTMGAADAPVSPPVVVCCSSSEVPTALGAIPREGLLHQGAFSATPQAAIVATAVAPACQLALRPVPKLPTPPRPARVRQRLPWGGKAAPTLGKSGSRFAAASNVSAEELVGRTRPVTRRSLFAVSGHAAVNGTGSGDEPLADRGALAGELNEKQQHQLPCPLSSPLPPSPPPLSPRHQPVVYLRMANAAADPPSPAAAGGLDSRGDASTSGGGGNVGTRGDACCGASVGVKSGTGDPGWEADLADMDTALLQLAEQVPSPPPPPSPLLPPSPSPPPPRQLSH